MFEYMEIVFSRKYWGLVNRNKVIKDNEIFSFKECKMCDKF